MLWILSQNYQGFPWSKGPKLSWISNDVDIIFLVETWEHKESKVPNIDGFKLCSTLNKQSSHRDIGGIACNNKKNISPDARIYKNDPYNQYSWIEITKIYDKNTYIAICYFPPSILTSIRERIQIKIVLTMAQRMIFLTEGMKVISF